MPEYKTVVERTGPKYGVFKWAGVGVGYFLGSPSVGFMLGGVLDALIWKPLKRRIEIPDQKNSLLSPETLVSSNVPLAMGFGSFFSAGNILDYAIERTYEYSTGWDPAERTNTRVYNIAIGISVNPAEIVDGTMGELSFIDNTVVTYEPYPEGGHSILPGENSSDYVAHFIQGDDWPGSWDTEWVHCFCQRGYADYYVSAFGPVVTVEKIMKNLEVFVHIKIDGEETIKKLESSDWIAHGADHFRYYVTITDSQDIRITWENETDDHPFNLSVGIFDGLAGGQVDDSWVFQCNWFAIQFNDDYFDPENSDFALVCNTGEDNAITNLQNYMTDINWGLRIPSDKLNTPSFATMVALAESEGYTFNGLFTSQSDPSDVISTFLRTSKALMVYSQNEFKIIADVFTTPTKTFQESNTIADSFQFTRKDTDSVISRLKVDFEDSEHGYAVRSVLLDSPVLFERIGIKDTSQFLTGVNTEAQALDIGDYLFRNLRLPNTVTFATSINDADVEPGDLFVLGRPNIQYGGVFRVAEIQEESNTEIQITGVSHFLEDEIITLSTEDDLEMGRFIGAH